MRKIKVVSLTVIGFLLVLLREAHSSTKPEHELSSGQVGLSDGVQVAGRTGEHAGSADEMNGVAYNAMARGLQPADLFHGGFCLIKEEKIPGFGHPVVLHGEYQRGALVLRLAVQDGCPHSAL